MQDIYLIFRVKPCLLVIGSHYIHNSYYSPIIFSFFEHDKFFQIRFRWNRIQLVHWVIPPLSFLLIRWNDYNRVNTGHSQHRPLLQLWARPSPVLGDGHWHGYLVIWTLVICGLLTNWPGNSRPLSIGIHPHGETGFIRREDVGRAD